MLLVHVDFQIFGFRKRFLAYLTGVFVAPVVSFHMFAQIILARVHLGPLLTLWALGAVIFPSIVQFGMVLILSLVNECLITLSRREVTLNPIFFLYFM